MARHPENDHLTPEELTRNALEGYIRLLQGHALAARQYRAERVEDVYAERVEIAQEVLGALNTQSPDKSSLSYLEKLADEARDAFNACTPRALLDAQAKRRAEWVAAEHRLSEGEGDVQ